MEISVLGPQSHSAQMLILRPGADLQNQSEHIRTHCQAMSKTGVHIFGDLERYFEHL